MLCFGNQFLRVSMLYFHLAELDLTGFCLNIET